jgi:hypothetical protein
VDVVGKDNDRLPLRRNAQASPAPLEIGQRTSMTRTSTPLFHLPMRRAPTRPRLPAEQELETRSSQTAQPIRTNALVNGRQAAEPIPLATVVDQRSLGFDAVDPARERTSQR